MNDETCWIHFEVVCHGVAGSKLPLPSGPSRRERLASIAEAIKEKPRASKEPQSLGLPGPRDESTWRGTLAAGVLGVAVVAGMGLAYRYLAAPEEETTAPSGSAEPISAPTLPPRCAPLEGVSDYVVGDPPKPVADADAGVEERDDTPFAAVLGRVIVTDRGFAVPVLGDGENGSVMSVVELDDHGVGRASRLSRSRGDLEPPVLFADGARVLGAAIEPNASGLALKLFMVEAGSVTWGAELEQPRDESLAVDVAASGDRGVLVWDAVKDDTSRVVMVSFKRGDVGTTTKPRAITAEGVDAEAPRLVPRAGGYFLVYRVRGGAFGGDAAPDDKSEKKKGSGSSSGGADDDVDESIGEKDFTSWVEALRLDENGSPEGSPERLTPREGQVTGFDVTAGKDAFTLAWRNQGGPSGSGGGEVHVLRVTTAGPLPEATVKEKGQGGGAAFESPTAPSAGIPVVLGTWIAVPTLRGHSLLAALDADGNPIERMRPEDSFGFGEPVAERGTPSVLLVAEPKGRAINLRLLRCGGAH